MINGNSNQSSMSEKLLMLEPLTEIFTSNQQGVELISLSIRFKLISISQSIKILRAASNPAICLD